MSNPTTPFSWQMPTSTDLVTDLPADFEVFGQAVATSMADLLGGTTGQYLVKNSATDMDFIWTTNAGDISGVTAGTGITGGGTSGTVTITNDMATTITAAGDIVVGTGSGTYDNLPIGTTGQVLTADTTVSPYKVKWGTASAAKNFTLVNAGGTALSGTTTTISGITDADELFIYVKGGSINTADGTTGVRLNTDTASNYSAAGGVLQAYPTYSVDGVDDLLSWQPTQPATFFRLAGGTSSNAASVFSMAMRISGCNSSGVKVMQQQSGASPGGGNKQQIAITGGFYNSASTISSISIVSITGGFTFDAGTVYVYKSA